jgi:alkanesulfonate monooxygenase SsuD/methylene tetrahydromethanopterin reductase-like flavin-dependent oxidoreductase (luciferase family)
VTSEAHQSGRSECVFWVPGSAGCRRGGSPEEVAELSGVLDRHCAEVGRDPGEICRSVQVRMPAAPDELLALAAAYAAVGVNDLLLILHAADPAAQAGQAGELLPRLRAEA